MKAEIVRNKMGEPRLLLTFETDEERELFGAEPTLMPCVVAHQAGGDDGDPWDEPKGVLLSMSFTLEDRDEVTLERVGEIAKSRGVPGPDVQEHTESVEGECFCRECLMEMCS